MGVNSEKILLERRGKLLIVKFNNPKKKNALDRNCYERLKEILNETAADDTITVLALTGCGDYYSSGNDLSMSPFADGSSDLNEFAVQSKARIMGLIGAFLNFPKLLIAVVNGPCFGIAATTAALCDVIYCSENAYFCTPFTRLGLCAEGCSSYTFPMILGKSKASEMLLLNHKLTAEEALRHNFVSEIFKTHEIETKIWKKLMEFSDLPIGAMIATKALMRKYEKDHLEKVNLAEADALYQRYFSEELHTAVLNFLASKKSKL